MQAMIGSKSQTRLLMPGLAGFYATWSEISFALLRVVIGYILFMHGWGKLTGPGIAGIASYMAKQGLEPGTVFASAAIFLETIGAVCLAIGLFTRFFGAALAIEMLIALIAVHAPHGFAAGKGGYEYVLLLGMVLFVIAIHGGGPYSVDAKLGKEL